MDRKYQLKKKKNLNGYTEIKGKYMYEFVSTLRGKRARLFTY